MEPLRCGKTGKINVFTSSLATHYHLPRLLGAQHDRAAAARRFSARQTRATRSFALILYSIACMRILAHNMFANSFRLSVGPLAVTQDTA